MCEHTAHHTGHQTWHGAPSLKMTVLGTKCDELLPLLSGWSSAAILSPLLHACHHVWCACIPHICLSSYPPGFTKCQGRAPNGHATLAAMMSSCMKVITICDYQRVMHVSYGGQSPCSLFESLLWHGDRGSKWLHRTPCLLTMTSIL